MLDWLKKPIWLEVDAERLVWKLPLHNTFTGFVYIIHLFIWGSWGEISVKILEGREESKCLYNFLKRIFGCPVLFYPHAYSSVPFLILQGNWNSERLVSLNMATQLPGWSWDSVPGLAWCPETIHVARFCKQYSLMGMDIITSVENKRQLKPREVQWLAEAHTV